MSKLSDLAGKISASSPAIKAFCKEAAAELDALAARVAKLEILVLPSGPPPPPPPPVTTGQVGVYRWGQNPSGVANFEHWLGRPVPIAEDFLDGSSWAGIEGPGWTLDPWRGAGRRLVLGVPMFPSGGTLAAGASGSYDAHFATLAQNLEARGLVDTIVRPGWEFGGSWFVWHPKTAADAVNYGKFFTNIAKAMRAVVPTLTFCWNGVWGYQDVAPDACWSPKADWVGVDVYDQTWVSPQTPQAAWADFMTTNNYSGQWWASFAKTKNKPLVIPEWGLSIRGDGHGLGDDPYFIDQMAAYMASNNVAWHVYFDVDASDGKHQISPPSTQFPAGSARYKAMFGA